MVYKKWLFFAFMFVISGFAQTNSDSLPKYFVLFEGKYTKTRVEIFADDSLCYKGVVRSQYPYFHEIAENIELFKMPRKIKIVINHFIVVKFTCDPAKPYLYIKRRWFFNFVPYEKAKLQQLR